MGTRYGHLTADGRKLFARPPNEKIPLALETPHLPQVSPKVAAQRGSAIYIAPRICVARSSARAAN